MSDPEECRLCTNVTDQDSAEKLFERNQRNLLRQIEGLIGLRLKNAKDLPQHICKSCEEKTLQAHTFRESCIQAQQYFTLRKKKKSTRQKDRQEVVISPVVEVVDKDLNSIKEENEEEKGNYGSPLAQITEVVFKNEPLKSDDDFSADESDDCFNPLDEDHPTTDEDMIAIEPEVKLIATEEPLLDHEEIPPNKNHKTTTAPKRKYKKKEKPLQEKNFSCDQCGKNFKKNSLLEVHMRRHTGDKPLICEVCSDRFLWKSDLKRHMLKHTGELPYPCGICDRRFRHKPHAQNHELTHAEERPHVCQQCGKAFHLQQGLKAHMMVHSSERTFKCDLCCVSFKQKTNLLSHYYSITHKQNEERLNSKQNFVKENNLICDQCGRHFISKSVLDTHIRRHMGERPFKCEICPESFFINADLKRHIQKHTGELPFPCSHCERRFLDKSHAKKHERTHTNERPYVCQECGKGFTLSTILKAHMVTHTGERTFECNMCHMAFKLRKHLVTHFRSKTHKHNEEKQQMSNI